MNIRRINVFRPCPASRFTVEVMLDNYHRVTIAEGRSLDDAQDVANQRREELEALGHEVYVYIDTRR
jgi:hypothetical protein